MVEQKPWEESVCGKKFSDIFGNIYAKDLWTNGSGPGSSLEATAEYRVMLGLYLRWLGIESILDFGCGDWQFSKFVKWGSTKYTGVDVVQSMMDNLQRKYGNKDTQFLTITNDFHNQLDFTGYDCVIVKDVLIHWPNEWIEAFLQLPYKRMLLVNDVSKDGSNKDIELGQFHALNLFGHPFNCVGKELFTFNGKNVIELIKQ